MYTGTLTHSHSLTHSLTHTHTMPHSMPKPQTPNRKPQTRYARADSVDEELDALRKRDAEFQGNQRAPAASSSRGGTLEDRLKRAEGLARVKNGGTMAGGGAHLMSVSLADKGDMGAVDGDEWQAMSFGGGGDGDAQPRKGAEDRGGKEGKGGGGLA
jgi:hypothetical protein